MAQSGAGKKGALVCNMEKVCVCVCIYTRVHGHASLCVCACICVPIRFWRRITPPSIPQGPTDSSPASSAKDIDTEGQAWLPPLHRNMASANFFPSQDLNFPFSKKEIMSRA